ncbi:MAG TPA: hypothetical protein VEA69_15490 [Tepidisphaeraceae bacterium]|nr:hypothetical protein [Tepidisphaeraceae bacterium]
MFGLYADHVALDPTGRHLVSALRCKRSRGDRDWKLGGVTVETRASHVVACYDTTPLASMRSRSRGASGLQGITFAVPASRTVEFIRGACRPAAKP